MTIENQTSVTRRRFLTATGASIVVAAVGTRVIGVFTPDPGVVDPVSASVLPGTFGRPAGKTLVVVELGGGNDGLNTVVPHGSAAYHDLRRAVAVPDPIDLDGEIGLHPALSGVADRWGDGHVAIVEGVGVPQPDLSHFVSMNRWWTGTPDAATSTGWLGRYLDGTSEDPLAGITIGPGPNRAMLGGSSMTVTISDASGLSPRVAPWIDDVDELVGAWEGFAAVTPDRLELSPIVDAIGSTVAARRSLGTALADAPPPSGPQIDLADQLDVAGRLVAADVAPAVVYVHGFGDFDTHVEQADRHAQLLGEVDRGITAFFEAAGDAGDRAVVLTASEFGRRAGGNGLGTDHGTAASHLLIGPGVVGGRHGEAPSLRALDPDGNLVHTVDYRSVYASVLDGWLEADADSILGGSWERLGLFS